MQAAKYIRVRITQLPKASFHLPAAVESIERMHGERTYGEWKELSVKGKVLSEANKKRARQSY
jgi:hypothetical protein